MTHIDGGQIHYLHIKSKIRNAVPLIVTHGWPGSFLEMLKVIPLLTEGDPLSFDLVFPPYPALDFEKISFNEHQYNADGRALGKTNEPVRLSKIYCTRRGFWSDGFNAHRVKLSDQLKGSSFKLHSI